MIRRYTLILIWLFAGLTNTSGYNGDSLRVPSINDLILSLETADSDTAKVHALINLSLHYRYSDIDSVKFFLDEASNYLESEIKPADAAQIYYLYNYYYFLKGDYEQALEYCHKGLEVLTDLDGNEIIKGDLLRAKGSTYAQTGMFELALESFLESEILYRKVAYKTGLFGTLNNIGVLYIKLESYNQAAEIFKELESMVDMNNPLFVTVAVNLGYVYYELGDFDLARKNLNHALNLKDVDKRAYGLSYFKLGEIYTAENELDKALSSFNESIKVYDEIFGNEIEKVQSLLGIANIYLLKKDYARAFDFASKAYEVTEQNHALIEQKNSLKLLYRIKRAEGAYKPALEYFEAFKAISDSLKDDETNAALGQLTAEFEYKDKEAQLLLREKTRALESEATIKKQRYLTIFLSFLSILGLLIIAILFYIYNQKKQHYELLSRKNEEIELQKEKLVQTNQIKNRLFSIIAHDLRGPLTSLHGLIMLVESKSISRDEMQMMFGELVKHFTQVSSLLNNLLQWSQSQMDGYKVLPEFFNINELIQDKAQLLKQRINEKELHFKFESEPFEVYADKNMIDLVLQNLISNAIKYCHSGDMIEITTRVKKDNVAVISVRDTGIGIPKEKIPKILSDQFFSTSGTRNEKGTGLGLMLCKDFVTRNGGEFWVNSTSGEGSSFYFTLPINPPSE